MSQNSTVPHPKFILQNSKPITYLLHSSASADLLYAGNRNGDITLYDTCLRRSIYSANPNNESILSIIELSAECFLGYCRNGTIFKWTKTNTEWNYECVYEKENYTFCQFVANRDRNMLCLPSNKASIVDCIDLKNYSKIASFKSKSESAQEQRGMLMCLKSVDSNSLFAGYENGEIVSFDLRTFNEINSLDLYQGQPMMCFDFSDSLKIGYTGSSGSKVHGFKLNETKLERSETINLVNPGVNSIKIRPSDSRIFAIGGWDSRIRIYSAKKQKFLACLDFHKEAINSIEFNSTNNLIYAGSNDGIISCWDLF